MARVSMNLRGHRDGTLTVKVGRAIEHIDGKGKTKAELFDYVKYAAISKGVVLSDATLTEALMKEVVKWD